MHHSEAKVKLALEACRSLLSDEEYRELCDYNSRHGEWGLAIETLADFLGEKEVKITMDQLTLIEAAFASMDLDPGARIQFLRQLMIGGAP